MKPVKPVPLSTDDVRRILAWAQAGGHASIKADEIELSRLLTNEAEVIATHDWSTLSEPRDQVIAEIRDRLPLKFATYGRLLALARQMRDAQTERAAEGIAAAVMANRRAERKADDDSKIVGEG